MSTTSPEAVRGVCGAMLALTTLATGLRLWARRLQKAPLGGDDWTIIPAWLLFVGMTTCVLLGVEWRLIAVTAAEAEQGAAMPAAVQAELFLAMDAQGTLSEGLTRISALLFFRRVFCVSGRSRGLRATIYAGIAVLVLWMVAFVTLPLMQCGPNLAVINDSPAVVAAHCATGIGTAFVLGYTVTNVVIELAIIALPIPLVVGLHTTVKRRLAVLFVFATAFLSVGVGCARLAAAVHASTLSGEALEEDNTQLCFFWVLGTGAALVAVNLPSLFSLVQKTKPEKILSGIRSAISLRSIASRNSGSGGSAAARDANAKSELSKPGHSGSDAHLHSPAAIHHSISVSIKTEDADSGSHV